MRSSVRRLTARLAGFVLPFALVLLLPAAVMYTAGEFDSIDKVIELQTVADRQVLFGRAYSDPTAHYKLESVLRRRPTVLALGTSRVMALRANMFREGVSFFNAGNGVTRLRHYRAFLRHIPQGSEPRLIVLGLDQYLFNENFDPLRDDDIEQLWGGDREVADIFFSSWIDIYRDFSQSKFGLRHLAPAVDAMRIGLNAAVHGNGFRNDGSYTWAQHVADPLNPENDDFEFRNTLSRIDSGYRRFEYGAHVSESALREVEALLEDCRDRGIHVVAFLPPFAHQIYETMRSRGTDYGYLFELRPALEPLFARLGFRLHDFSDLAWLDASDRETIDGFHGSEKAYVRLMAHLVEGDAMLRGYARDAAWLRHRVDTASGDQLVFPLYER